MRSVACCLLLVALPGPVWAQSSLSDQINSVYSAQQQNDAAAQAQAEAQQQAILQQQQREWAAARSEAAARDAREAAKEAEVEADKKRDEAYQDQLRALDLQERELQLEAEKARVARENEFIDQDLNRSKAETDAIQSQADATRNISSGEKSFLDQEGEAAVRAESGAVSN